MTRRELAALACRILALAVAAVGAIECVPVVVELIAALLNALLGRRHPTGWAESVSNGTVGMAELLIALLFWYGSETIAQYMVIDEPTPITGDAWSGDVLWQFASVAIGLTSFTWGLPYLARLAAGIAFDGYNFGEYWQDSEWRATIFSSIVMIVWVVWLMLGGRGLVKLLRWGRAAQSNEGPIRVESETAAIDHDDKTRL